MGKTHRKKAYKKGVYRSGKKGKNRPNNRKHSSLKKNQLSPVDQEIIEILKEQGVFEIMFPEGEYRPVDVISSDPDIMNRLKAVGYVEPDDDDVLDDVVLIGASAATEESNMDNQGDIISPSEEEYFDEDHNQDINQDIEAVIYCPSTEEYQAERATFTTQEDNQDIEDSQICQTPENHAEEDKSADESSIESVEESSVESADECSNEFPNESSNELPLEEIMHLCQCDEQISEAEDFVDEITMEEIVHHYNSDELIHGTEDEITLEEMVDFYNFGGKPKEVPGELISSEVAHDTNCGEVSSDNSTDIVETIDKVENNMCDDSNADQISCNDMEIIENTEEAPYKEMDFENSTQGDIAKSDNADSTNTKVDEALEDNSQTDNVVEDSVTADDTLEYSVPVNDSIAAIAPVQEVLEANSPVDDLKEEIAMEEDVVEESDNADDTIEHHAKEDNSQVAKAVDEDQAEKDEAVEANVPANEAVEYDFKVKVNPLKDDVIENKALEENTSAADAMEEKAPMENASAANASVNNAVEDKSSEVDDDNMPPIMINIYVVLPDLEGEDSAQIAIADAVKENVPFSEGLEDSVIENSDGSISFPVYNNQFMVNIKATLEKAGSEDDKAEDINAEEDVDQEFERLLDVIIQSINEVLEEEKNAKTDETDATADSEGTGKTADSGDSEDSEDSNDSNDNEFAEQGITEACTEVVAEEPERSPSFSQNTNSEDQDKPSEDQDKPEDENGTISQDNLLDDNYSDRETNKESEQPRLQSDDYTCPISPENTQSERDSIRFAHDEAKDEVTDDEAKDEGLDENSNSDDLPVLFTMEHRVFGDIEVVGSARGNIFYNAAEALASIGVSRQMIENLPTYDHCPSAKIILRDEDGKEYVRSLQFWPARLILKTALEDRYRNKTDMTKFTLKVMYPLIEEILGVRKDYSDLEVLKHSFYHRMEEYLWGVYIHLPALVYDTKGRVNEFYLSE